MDNIDDAMLMEKAALEENKGRKQVATTIDEELETELNNLLKDEHWFNFSTYLRELIRRDVVRYKNARANRVLKTLIENGAITPESLVELHL